MHLEDSVQNYRFSRVKKKGKFYSVELHLSEIFMRFCCQILNASCELKWNQQLILRQSFKNNISPFGIFPSILRVWCRVIALPLCASHTLSSLLTLWFMPLSKVKIPLECTEISDSLKTVKIKANTTWQLMAM